WNAVGQRGIHMEVRIDEGRRHQVALCIDLGRGGTRQVRLDRADGLADNADIGDPAIRQRAAAHDEVEIHLSSSPLKYLAATKPAAAVSSPERCRFHPAATRSISRLSP